MRTNRLCAYCLPASKPASGAKSEAEREERDVEMADVGNPVHTNPLHAARGSGGTDVRRQVQVQIEAEMEVDMGDIYNGRSTFVGQPDEIPESTPGLTSDPLAMTSPLGVQSPESSL